MVFSPVRAELHGEVRRGPPQRLSDPATPALVRRGVSYPGTDVLDAAAPIYRTGDLARVGEDGLVYFLGRTDSQIKSRGYRIELGEIETAVCALDGVVECAVVAIATTGFERVSIGCAYAPLPGAAVTPVQLRQALSRVVPGYMLPSRWLAFDVLPKPSNGKVDRRRLTEAFQETFQRREAQ